MDQEMNVNKVDSLAKDVLMLSRNTLLVNLRFLDAALSQFSLEAQPGSSISTDGQTLYYDALYVLRAYRAEHAVPVRDYLHLVLHCIFRHMYNHTEKDPEVWNLACDIAVEHSISELGLTAVAVEREKKQQEITSRLKEEIGLLTAEKLYRYLLNKPFWMESVENMDALFRADDHRLWYEDSQVELNQQAAEHTEEDAIALHWAPPGVEEIWKDISQRMQVDMETFARKQGDKAEAMMQNLREVNRETYDYTGFLQKFAAKGEPMKTDPEEFDYIFYTYGMSLYDKMPLIEPVEFKAVKRVKEFVIAVDLSGLVSHEQACRFLRKSYEVFKAAETAETKIDLHILTCAGSDVPVHTAIASEEELEQYLSALKIRQPGEVDFRPAFLWTDEVVAKREFRNFKGVIYFTDGVGAFPAKKPAYDAAFVFVNDNYSTPDVPPWAIRLVLQKEELDDGE